MKFITAQNISWIMITVVAVAVWFGLELLSNATQPKLIVDKDVTVDMGGVLLNPPVELTGKPVEQGTAVIVCGSVPESWQQYVHYDNFVLSEWNPFNPKGKIGYPLLYGLSAIAIVLLGLVIRKAVILHKKDKLKL